MTLLATDTATLKHIFLPSSPRQRRDSEDTKRGWDFTIWAISNNGTYNLSAFTGRTSDVDNNLSADYGVLSVTEKALGQYKPVHNFATSRLLLAKRQNPHAKYDSGQVKRFASAQHSIAQLLDEAA